MCPLMCADQIKMKKIEVRKDGLLLRSVTILSLISIADVNGYFVQISLSHFTQKIYNCQSFNISIYINPFQRRADEKIFIVFS